MELVVQVTSLSGAGLVLLAFVALQRGRWSSRDSGYLWCNFLGAALLTIVAVVDRRIGFIVLEAVWALVSLHAMFRRPPAAQGPRIG
jgi:hypothetical protein